jgi:hypothetical protein
VAEEPTPNAPLTLRARVRTLPNGEVRTATAQALSAPKAALEMDYRIPFGGGLLGIAVDVLDSQGKARAIRLDILRVPDAIDASLQLPLLYRTDEAVRLAGRLAIPAASLEKATFEVALCVGGKPTAPGAVQIGAGGAFHAALPVSSLAPGRYAVEARLVVPDLSDQPIVQRFPFQLLGGPAE